MADTAENDNVRRLYPMNLLLEYPGERPIFTAMAGLDADNHVNFHFCLNRDLTSEAALASLVCELIAWQKIALEERDKLLGHGEDSED